MTKHDEVATRLAKKFGTKYNRGKGADVKLDDFAVEVETKRSLKKDGLRQLRGYRSRVYIAMADDKDIQHAREMTKDTTVGVMNTKGEVVKPSTR